MVGKAKSHLYGIIPICDDDDDDDDDDNKVTTDNGKTARKPYAHV